MFKRLSVGKKMAVGFGIEILLILLSAVLAAVTILSRISALEEFYRMADLQGDVGGQLKSFQEARMLADTVIVEIDDEAYAAYMGAVGETLSIQSGLAEKAEETGSALLEDIRRMEPMLDRWEAHVSGVQEINTVLATQTAALEAMLSQLADSGNALFTQAMADGGGAEQLQTAADIMVQLERVRTDGIEAVYLFETTDVTPVLDRIDGTLDMLDALDETESSQGLEAVRSDLTKSLARYRTAFEAFAALSEDSVDLHEDPAYALAEELSQMTIDLSNSAEAEMQALITKTLDEYKISLAFTVGLAAMGVLIACVVAAVITAKITRPLERMQALLTRMGEQGDMAVTGEEMEQLKADAEARDEVGESIRAFAKTLRRQKELCEAVERIADGDLTVEIEPLSDRDAMGHSLATMIEALDRLFAEIRDSADAVAGGAGSLADGSQSLAQNNAEQAASVEQLNAAVTQVAASARRSTESALQAVRRSEAVSRSAEQGKEKMASLVQAVENINTAGQSIQKIIKTIDDIAFQTNILALNAAVEAARSGNSGKGFAVVASEVRNLAGRSAQAARDTDRLISQSLQLVEEGLVHSEATAQSFVEIIGGVRQSSRDMEEIARLMEEQTNSFNQIDLGIGQIAQSIQQNSSTSEETAVASEEMSGLAGQLYRQIDQFRLRESSARREETPETARPLMEPLKHTGGKY